jgi:hypothetical protein
MDCSMRILCAALVFVIGIQTLVQPAYPQNPPASIQIVVVDGEGAINNVGQRSPRNPIVQVQDANGKPVAGAAVVFSLPTEGASGEFGNGEKTLIVVTDERGEAVASGLRVNTISGRLQIHVNASYRGRTARTNITQFNMAVPGKRVGGSSSKTVLILLAIAGAAGGGAAVALRSRNGSPAPSTSAAATPPIGITPGTGMVGPPR